VIFYNYVRMRQAIDLPAGWPAPLRGGVVLQLHEI